MNQELILSQIETMIYIVRGQKVMLDTDLAELYGVKTNYLNKAVKRNELRFPEDFMFQLTDEEFSNLKDELGVSGKYGGTRKNPNVFTENGLAMLSGVLNSERAVLVNISIMRIFTKLRGFLFLEKNLTDQMNQLELNTNKIFKIVFERLDEFEQMLSPKLPEHRKKIGLNKDKPK